MIFCSLLLNASEIAENAFGNVAGGQLWGSISVDWCDFPELTFRLMLKTAFDKGLHGTYNWSTFPVKLNRVRRMVESTTEFPS